ncbi:tRNA-dihydrouridine synthase [Helcococcus kunzii]|uniref:tRNA dihydrouridine synthase n=1 Tax=Helcococcus kunzii TaxID=40091 RepID=UPI001C94E3BA|nr:tRNA-dihydrouridine synthase [Helcococcus kunzii]QZO75986.1 tRNA-dihydrouridine synthase [Helcococcus kunzii]
MKENFWNDLPRPFFILAPMEDVTDTVFRHVVAKAAAPDVFFTEFTDTNAYNLPKVRDTLDVRLLFTEDEQPIVAHIWGDVPENFENMAKGLAEMGYKGIDINMGCPAANVVKKGKGSGLIKRPEVAANIIQAAKAGGIPVSVKTRLGYLKVDEYKEWISHLLRQDIANLTIHLRTKKEMSFVDAHWELIPEIVKLRDEIAPNTLITINGDIPDRKVGMELVEKYGVDGVMIGRGIFRNVFAFEKEQRAHSHKEFMDLFYYHLDYYEEMVEKEPRLSKVLNRLFKTYVKDFKGSRQLRDTLVRTKSVDEVREVLANFEHIDAIMNEEAL